MKHTGNKALSWLLTLALVLGFIPTLAIPAGADEAIPYVYYEQAADGKSATRHTDGSCTSYTTVAGSEGDVSWYPGDDYEGEVWYVVSEDVTIGGHIMISGVCSCTVNLILCDGKTLTAEKGIYVENGFTLNIYVQSGGTGALTATGSDGGAGIGGLSSAYADGGNITIHGGVVSARGSTGSAGIGGSLGSSTGGDPRYPGKGGSSGTVIIYAGTVNATGGDASMDDSYSGGAGIGGGSGVYASSSGGEGGYGGPGGSVGEGGDCGAVYIYGGTVNATGRAASAGIGGGAGYNGRYLSYDSNGGSVGSVFIYGGTVTTAGGTGANGIDSGYNCTYGTGELKLGDDMELYGGSSENPTSPAGSSTVGTSVYYDRYPYMTAKPIPAAKVGNNEYDTVQAALTAASAESEADAKTVKLFKNSLIETGLTVASGKYVKLDLNGFTIDRGLTGEDAVSNGYVLKVDGNLSLDDSSSAKTGKLTGGNNSGHGGGVYVNGTLNMSGGAISNNATTLNGGGVYVNSGTFTMSNTAAISGNTASYGGGLRVSGGTFNMNGGTISENTAVSNGGGVYYSGGTINVSGGASVTGNHKGTDASAAGYNNNVYIVEDKLLTVTGALTGSIGVTMQSNTGAFAQGGGEQAHTLDSEDVKHFTSDIAGYSVRRSDEGKAELVALTVIEMVEGTLTKGGAAWVAEDDALKLTGGYYKLGSNITIPNGISVAETVTLDLNGFTIDRGLTGQSAETDGYVLKVEGDLTLMDSSDNPETTAYDGTGTITGGNNNSTSVSSKGGGVYVYGGTLSINGGTISGNTSAGSGANGGGVYVEGGTLTMSGGAISNNATTSRGGGVYVDGGTFTMSGGTISENTADSNGGGVCITYINTEVSSTFNMSGTAEISRNTANGSGGGVYVDKGGTFTMSDTAAVKDNTATDGGGIRLFSSTFNMNGGSVSGNTATSDVGGVNISYGTTVTVSGSATITGNHKGTDATAAGYNNNVSINWTQLLTVTGELTGSIGVTMGAGSGAFAQAKTGEGAYNEGRLKDTDVAHFTSDSTKYDVGLNDEGKAVLVKRPVTVTLTGGANATRSGGDATQSNLTGAMTTVTYTANTGYHFAEFANITNNGVTAKRTSDTVVTVSGTPTGNASITVPDAVANTYTVQFDGNGKTGGSMSDQGFTYGTEQALTANAFTRAFTVTYTYNGATGGNGTASATATATFNGWAESADGNKVYDDKASVSNLTVTNGAAVTLYAKWTDGSVTLPTPTKTGSTFGGWYSDAALKNKVGDGGASYKPAANITLYAKWTANTYTVKFDGNGKTGGSMNDQSFTCGTAQALTTNAFTRAFTVTYTYNGATGGNTAASATANATFNGWAESASGAVKYIDKQSVNNLTATNGATVTLYAKWTDGNVTLPTPTKTGSTFGGWYSDSGCQTKVGDGGASYTPTANITLYAKWTEVKASVGGDLSGTKFKATVTAPNGGLLIAASYTGTGKQVGVWTQTVTAGSATIETTLDVTKGYTYKVMLVNSGSYAPLCEAWEKTKS